MTNLNVAKGFAPVFNGHLYYEAAGSGQSILFIHAGVANCRMWDDQFRYFARNYQVIRYDARGFGKSHTETTEFSNRQDILDLLDHLGVHQAVVIGISRGGQIAIDFTLEHPERVSALVAVAAGVSGFDYQPGDNDQAVHEYELFNRADELWEKKAFTELADLEVHAWADGPSQPVGRAPAHIREYIRKVVLANYTRKDGTATPIPLDPPAAGRLGEIHVPTLVVVGGYDTTGTLAISQKLELEIPGAHRLVFSETAHMLPMEHPGKFNEAVSAFLRNEGNHD